ncbi:MAG: APC family permease [Bradyrhizobium sp.]|nr:APC family permease [Bradyrhizobium sp.]
MTLASDNVDLNAVAKAAANLRAGALTPVENLSQSIANIAPTMTPALNVTVVAGLAGGGTWLAYVIATIAMLIVGVNINVLARRHSLSGSFFVYIGRTLGPFAGVMAGWSMIAAYLLTAVAVIVSIGLFVSNVMTEIGITGFGVPSWALTLVLGGLITFAAYRDIKMSSRLGLLLEGVSVAIIIVIIATVAVKQGTVVDPSQTSLSNIHFGGVVSALTFAVFSFVGFESSATLSKETADARRIVPRSILYSAAIVGIFFVITSYFMILGVGGKAELIAGSSSPIADVTNHAGLGWLAVFVYVSAIISAFACALASINAASRLIFSMGRFRFLGAATGAVHAAHQTPHVAVLTCGIACVILSLALLPFGALNAFGYAGTIATFGFLVVYLLVCVVAPLDAARFGELKIKNVLASAAGVLLMLFVDFGSLYPVPDYPMNLLPYIFLLYMAVGAAWFYYLKRTSPGELANIEHDLEG